MSGKKKKRRVFAVDIAQKKGRRKGGASGSQRRFSEGRVLP